MRGWRRRRRRLGTRTALAAATRAQLMQKPFAQVVLHFGADKTGSSSIQSFLDRTRETLLLEQGIAYAPGIRHGRLGSRFTTDPMRYILNREEGVRDPETIRAADDAYVAGFERWLAGVGGARVMALSYEGFLDMDATGLERLRAFCAELADDVDVLIYVRPPLSYARSAISQRVRTGRPAWPAGDPPVRRYRDRLQPIVATFGKGRTHVRRFARENLAGGDVVSDFCRLLGVDGEALKRVGGPPAQLNASLSELAAMVGEALREQLESAGYRLPPADFESRFGDLLARIEGRPILLEAEQAAAVLREHSVHGQYLRDEFGLELPEEVSSHMGTEPPPEVERALSTSLARDIADTFLTQQRVSCAAGTVSCDNPPRELSAGARVTLPVVLHNYSSQEWLALGPHPVRLSYHWLTGGAALHLWDGLRSDLPVARLPAGGSIAMTARVEAPPERGSFVLQLVALQEGRSWLDAKGFTAASYAMEVV